MEINKQDIEKEREIIKDLQQQLAEKDKEISKLKQTINTLHQNIRNASVEDVNLIHELENQLSEQEKEIAEYNEYFERFACENFDEFKDFISTFMLTPHEEQTLIRELKNKLKAIRHQVCEEIRAFFDVNPDTVEWDYLNEILNQVEGENNDN